MVSSMSMFTANIKIYVSSETDQRSNELQTEQLNKISGKQRGHTDPEELILCL